MTGGLAECATRAATRGWHVFPCRPTDKRPAVERWEQRAISDPARVARYWPSPRHNIGLACGPSGLVVLDLDTVAHGARLPDRWQLPGINDGADVLAYLLEQYEQQWPHTYTVRTPTGGWHLYFRAPSWRTVRNSAGKVGPMVDVRAGGGYVVAAGSVTATGMYTVTDDTRPAPLPGWLVNLAAPPTPPPTAPTVLSRGGPADGRLRGLIQTVLDAPQGQRNSSLYWSACRVKEMTAAGEITEQSATEALVRAATGIGLSETEAHRTINSAWRGAA